MWEVGQYMGVVGAGCQRQDVPRAGIQDTMPEGVEAPDSLLFQVLNAIQDCFSFRAVFNKM